MKTFTLTLPAYVLFSISVVSIDIDQRRVDNYYERMAFLYLTSTASFIRDTPLPDAGAGLKEETAADVAFTTFSYWMRTEYGNERPSERFDRLLRRFYRHEFSRFSERFRDPLGWSRPEGPTQEMESAPLGITKQNYQHFIGRFWKFLNSHPNSSRSGNVKGAAHAKMENSFEVMTGKGFESEETRFSTSRAWLFWNGTNYRIDTREVIGRDLVFDFFTYWVLVSEGALDRSAIVEATIRNIYERTLRSHKEAEQWLGDPQAWYLEPDSQQPVFRSAAFDIPKARYPEMVNEFRTFLNENPERSSTEPLLPKPHQGL